MTPLIDVIFLLLIFFMISTTFIETNEIQIVLPEVSTKSNQTIKGPLELTITAQNKVYTGKRYLHMKTLKRSIAELVNSKLYKSAIIRADGNVKHKVVVHLMDILKQSGIQNISIATLIKTS